MNRMFDLQTTDTRELLAELSRRAPIIACSLTADGTPFVWFTGHRVTIQGLACELSRKLEILIAEAEEG
jgi:hypothetical protein